MKYAGFWKRFVALMVDFIVILPLVAVYVPLSSMSKPMAALILLPMMVIGQGYQIGCHAKWGRTIGKYAAGIRVVRPDGSRIGWREAWQRSSVDIGFALLTNLGLLWAICVTPSSLWETSNWYERQATLASALPAAFRFIDWGQTTWVLGEVVVVLFNRKRRSLHDFIAGTVVIIEADDAVPGETSDHSLPAPQGI